MAAGLTAGRGTLPSRRPITAEVFLPVLGANLMLFGGVEQRVTALFWLGSVLVVAGLGMEAVSLWRDTDEMPTVR
ncbi:hypothetical protein [Streptomyces sp. NPDC058457]|uniref:hypothetical protein n=1 Tax=Streptomyces sp. NPDC058457 TaxID=3346507 RepID=UPI00365B2678